jgi:hypothetical protein
MRKKISTLVALFFTLNVFFAAALFAQSGHTDHSSHTGTKTEESMDMGGHDMGESSRGGMKIHESMVEGYHFEYRLIDTGAKMKSVKGMEHITHHMMVYVKGPEKIEKIKVGYLVTGPDGSKQKLMAMSMGGGSGADVSFASKGMYMIKTKVVADGTKLSHMFHYEVK